MAKYHNFHKKEIVDIIYDCFDKLRHIYFREWLTTKEIQDYILQESGILVKRTSIANTIKYYMVGIKRDKLRYTELYGKYQHTFLKTELGLSYDSNIYKKIN